MESYAKRRVAILGFGTEGIALTRFLSEQGAEIRIIDDASEEALRERLLRLPPGAKPSVAACNVASIEGVDVLFVSPGVPESNPVYSGARRRNIPIGSMTTLFFEMCPARIVGVTGSSGKTTTTSLIAHILEEAGVDAVVGGNIGTPMVDLLDRVSPTSTVVLELSSFQLEILDRSPNVAVVTNISPNHLDRHADMDAYVKAKLNIVRHQSPSDFAVLNRSDRYAQTFARATQANIRWFASRSAPGYMNPAYEVHEDTIGIWRADAFASVIRVRDLPLIGVHNEENALAAVAVADILGVAPDVMGRAIKSFEPPPHRLQLVGERGGVRYVDDSIATSPARAAAALLAFDSPILLIAGGRDKKLPWEELAELAVERARAVFLLGEAAGDIDRALRSAMKRVTGRLDPRCINRCSSLLEAVSLASRTAEPGDVVLLSPACASYDMFRNFEERGKVFARAVEQLDAA